MDTNPDDDHIDVQSLATGERKTLQRGGRYLPSGHLVYVRQGTLFAAPMDLDRLELTGAPAPGLEEIAVRADGGAQFDFSQTGMFLYLGGDQASSKTTIHWLDHTGKTEPLLATPGRYMQPRLSPDGRRLALVTGEFGNSDISVYDWGRDTMSRLTFAPGQDSHPVWTPDGRFIAFRSDRDGGFGNIYLSRADGAGEAQRLTENKHLQNPSSFSPGGKRLAYFEIDAETSWDVWTLPLQSSDSQPPHAALPWPGWGVADLERRRWNPVWSPNGRELFYASPNNQIMVTAFTADGDTFRADQPRLWSETRFYSTSVYESIDLAPDGKRFVILLAANGAGEQEARTRVTVLLNFFDELRRRLAAGGE